MGGELWYISGLTVDLEWGGVVVVPLIVGLVEVAKRLGLSTRYAALVSLTIGLAISLGAWVATQAGEPAREGFQAALVGLALGLSASGLYSVARAVGNGKRSVRNEESSSAPAGQG